MDSAIVLLSNLLPIILFLVFSVKRAKIELWVIFFYTLFTFVFDWYQSASNFGKEHYEESMGIFTICEFAIFGAYFYLAIINKSIRKLILVLSLLVLAFLVVTFIKSDKNSFDSVSASTESITLIVFCIFFFFEEINKPMPYLMYAFPNFWIVLGILIFMSATLFLFIIANKLSPQEQTKYWVITRVANIVSNIIFIIGFIRAKYAPTNSTIEKSPLEFSNIPENQGN